MMMRDFGQFTYGSATMVQSAAAVTTSIIAGAIFWHLHPSSALEAGLLIRYEETGLTDGKPHGKAVDLDSESGSSSFGQIEFA